MTSASWYMTAIHSSAATVTRSLDRFVSAGRKVRMETYSPPDAKCAPSIVVLHGATGVEYANRFIASLAQGMAVMGFVTHLVHYFDRTGTQCASEGLTRRMSAAWLATIQDALVLIREQRPEAPIGVFGYSLGGYLTAAECGTNREISAAVVLAGGVSPGTVFHRTSPTLILHGDQDARVPVSAAWDLADELQLAGCKPEMHVYNGEGHIMTQETCHDVVGRSASFFHKHLNARAA